MPCVAGDVAMTAVLDRLDPFTASTKPAPQVPNPVAVSTCVPSAKRCVHAPAAVFASGGASSSCEKRHGQGHPRRVPQRTQIRQIILERPVERAGLARVHLPRPLVAGLMSPLIAMTAGRPRPGNVMVKPLIGLSDAL